MWQPKARHWKIFGILGAISLAFKLCLFLLKPATEASRFADFANFRLPEDATAFTWTTTGHDEFGDHDGRIRFSASRASLERILDMPFRAASQWTKVAGTDSTYVMRHEEPGEVVNGWICLDQGACGFDYRTW